LLPPDAIGFINGVPLLLIEWKDWASRASSHHNELSGPEANAVARQIAD
jgi:hypothetical protein